MNLKTTVSMTPAPVAPAGRVGRRVYLDHAASAPVRPVVASRMLEVLSATGGNASSAHAEGRQARAILEQARAEVASLAGCRPEAVIFTSGGTEANNLAVLGAAHADRRRRHLVVSAVEHASVLEPCRALTRAGFEWTVVPPAPDGRVDAGTMAAALRPDTALCALMLANNEVGALQPVVAVAAACRRQGVPLLVDAVAAAGRVPLAAATAAADFVSLAAHKLGGPQGAGALIVAADRDLAPPWRGGSQERRWRPGTEAVAVLAGFGCAARLALIDDGREPARLRRLSSRLAKAVLAVCPEAVPTGPDDLAQRLPGLVSFVFPALDGEALRTRLDLDGVAVGAGAACSSGAAMASHVLAAMGYPSEACRAAVRLSLGWNTRAADVDRAAAALGAAVALQRRSRAG